MSHCRNFGHTNNVLQINGYLVPNVIPRLHDQFAPGHSKIRECGTRRAPLFMVGPYEPRSMPMRLSEGRALARSTRVARAAVGGITASVWEFIV